MNDNYIKNETRDIYESLEKIECMEFINCLLGHIIAGVDYNDKIDDKIDYNEEVKELEEIKRKIENIIEK